MDETNIKIKGQWKYLHRAVETAGQTIVFHLTAKRDTGADKPEKKPSLSDRANT